MFLKYTQHFLNVLVIGKYFFMSIWQVKPKFSMLKFLK